jgi:hypothetical protein
MSISRRSRGGGRWPRLWVLSEPHFDDRPRRNDCDECSERSYDYASYKPTVVAPFCTYLFALKAGILLRKPLLSLDALFSRQVSTIANPKFVPDLGSTEALKVSAVLGRYCHLSAFSPPGPRLRVFDARRCHPSKRLE